MLWYCTSPLCRSTVALIIISLCSRGVLVSSGSVVELSFANASVTGGLWVTDTRHELSSLDEVVVRITAAPPTIAFSVIHVHCFPTTSYVEVKSPHNATTITGSDVGIVHPIAPGPADFIISNPLRWAVQLLIVVRAYNESYPVPGGCAMEFPTKVAPYLIVENGNQTITVKGQKGAEKINDQLCLNNDLEYEFYYTYTTEMIDDASNHFARLRAMLNYSEIVDKAYKAHWMDGSPTQRVFAKYPGVCTYYAMAVRGPLGTVALYSPSSSMLCGANEWSSLSLGMKTLVVLLIPIGMILCFAGHSMPPTSVFFTTFFAGHSLSYVGLTQSGVAPDDAWTYAIYVAAAIAACVLFVLLVVYCPICLIIPAVTCGCYLFWAAIFYIFTGNLQMFADGPSFWALLIALVVGLGALMIMWPTVGFMATLSLIGSYLINCVIDYIFGTHLKYVTINPIRKLTVQGFDSAITSPPLETADIMMFVLWIGLAIFGFEKQRRRARGKAPFPPPPRLPFITRSSEESRPLLQDSLEDDHRKVWEFL